MASVDECRTALATLAANLAAHADQVRERVTLNRTLACRVTDLGVAFRGTLRGGRLEDITEADDPAAKIVLSATSDDLIAMVNGELDFARALMTRRVAVRASPFDLIKLRKLL